MTPKDGEPFGYDIDGPVRLGADGAQPAADVTYTQVANGEQAGVRLVLPGDGTGYVVKDGRRTQLSEEQTALLAQSGIVLGPGGLGSIDFERWIRDPKRTDGPDGTDKVTGELDVAAAMAGLSALSGLLERDVTLTPEQRRQVADAVEESHFELLTGSKDRLLRKLALDFTVGADVPESLRGTLGEEAVGAGFSFELELAEVNEPVQIG